MASPFGNTGTPGFGSSTNNQTSTSGSLFGQQTAPFGSSQPGQSMFGVTTQTASVFGPPSTTSSSLLFGQNTAGQLNSPFTQNPSLFGQSTSTQPNPAFGSNPVTQSNTLFGQSQITQSSALFGQSPATQTANLFGQSPVTQSSALPLFGQSPATQTATLFGQSPVTQSSASFGQSSTVQSGSLFGQIPVTQSSALFGQSSTTASSLPFGQTSLTQSGALFGQTSTPAAGSLFGQSSTTQPSSLFGQSSTQSSSPFGHSSVTQSSSTFGQSNSQFSQNGSQSTFTPIFGQTTTASSNVFGQTAGSISSAAQSGPGSTVLFGQPTSRQSSPKPFAQASYGQATAFRRSPSLVSQSTAFSQSTMTASQHTSAPAGFGGPTSAFGQPTTTGVLFGQTSGFGVASTTVPTFGVASTTVPTFGVASTTVPTFGVTTSSSAQPNQQTLSSNTFSHGTAPGASLFGRNEPNQTSSLPSSMRPGDAMRTVNYPDLTKPPPAYGAVSMESKQPGLFGGLQTNQEAGKGPGTSGLFGMAGPSDQSRTGATGFGTNFSATANVKKEPGTTETGLFGMKSESGQAETNIKAPFGKGSVKSEPHTSSGITGRLFGKGGVKTETSSSRGLFGKDPGRMASSHPNVDSAATATTSGLFGKGPATTAAIKQEPGEQTPAVGLFGRPVSRKSKRTSSSEGLFGKPAQPQTDDETGAGADEGGKRVSLRRMTSEDNSDKMAIVCRNVPTKFNTQFCLRKHFSQYGQVAKVYPNTAKMQAIIHYTTHEAAADAKRRGRVIVRGQSPLTIFWSRYTAPGTPKTTSPRDQEPGRSRVLKRPAAGAPVKSRYTWRAGDAVSDELSTMSGSQDVSQGTVKGEPQSRAQEKRGRAITPDPSAFTEPSRASKVSVENFQGAIARSTSDRLYLLVQRDKYVRQCLNLKEKGAEIATASAFVGTCEDMCPEKERYEREEQRRLHVYEMVPGTENIPGRNPQVDHCRAVKEYKRPTPDQLEPLPHELRPLSVLQMTMAYLLAEVADRGQDGRWGDWFDFLWNRTRGIRKDITQLQLADRGTVELIEKCTRFHIFCAERLCEEDMHSFDEKINNENLTKCLQTLKEFYHDLHVKQNVFCPNEAEFRGYTVLMNLNEGDTLRQVQQLRPDVRNTRDVNFALSVYSALNNNNYIRFFRLVKQATFGAGCIMHRYFTQVRNRALRSMMKGYGMGNRAAQLPVSEIERLLGFETELQAADFCEHYGFVVGDEEVMLDRAEYIEPETAFVPCRSVQLIESKRMVSIGEMINGGALPKFERHNPDSSFDVQGRFMSAAQLPNRGVEPSTSQQPHTRPQAEVKVEPVTLPAVKPEPIAVPEPKHEIPKQKLVFSTEYIKDAAKTLFWEVIDVMCPQIAMEMMEDVKAKLECSDYLAQLTVDSTVLELSKSLCQEVYDEAMALKYKAEMEERERRRDRVAAMLTVGVIDDVIYQESLNLATVEVREVKAQLKRECVERVTVNINHELCSEITDKMLREVASDVFETDVTQRLEQLAEFERIVKLARAGRFLLRWRKEFKAVTKLKRAMLEFPSTPSLETTSQVVDKLIGARKHDDITDGGFYVSKRARLTVESPMEVAARWRKTDMMVRVQTMYRQLLKHSAWQPLDLSKLVGNRLQEKLCSANQRDLQTPGGISSIKGQWKSTTLHFKLLLCLPEEETEDGGGSLESISTAHICKWLTTKFSRGTKPKMKNDVKGGVISLYRTRLAQTSNHSSTPATDLGVCVRTVHGILDVDDVCEVEENRLFLGTNGLVFVLPSNPPLEDPASMYWRDNRLRLERILEVKPMYQSLPLVIVLAASANQNMSYMDLSQYLSLDHFIEDGSLSGVEMVVLDLDTSHREGINVTDPQVSEKLCVGIQWLASETTPPPTLEVGYLRDYVEDFLIKHYYAPALQNLKMRKTLGCLHKDPNCLLHLYNMTIQHLADVATSDNLRSVSWPVMEFVSQGNSDIPPIYWNSEDHFEYLYQLIESLKLPEFVPLQDEPEDWQDAKRDIWNCLSTVCGKNYGPARVDLVSRMNKLLKRVEDEFEESCYALEGEWDCRPQYASVPWADVVAIFIDYRLKSLDVVDPDAAARSVDDDSTEELRVAYFEEELRNFEIPQEWRHVESDRNILDAPSVNDTILASVTVCRKQAVSASPAMMTIPKFTIGQAPKSMPKSMATSLNYADKLKLMLNNERRRSDHFDKYLQSAINDGAMECSNSEERLNSSESVNPLDSTASSRSFLSDLNNSHFMGNDSFEATKYFGGNQGDLSNLFKPINESLINSRGQGHQFQGHYDYDGGHPDAKNSLDVSGLYGKARQKRLSEIYGDNPILIYLNEPTIPDDVKSLKADLKSERRESDLFERKLLAMIEDN